VVWCRGALLVPCRGAQCRGGAERVWCRLLLVLVVVGEVPFLVEQAVGSRHHDCG